MLRANILTSFLNYILLVILFSSCSNPVRRELSKITAPYNGEQFNNLEPFPEKSFWDLLKWKFSTTAAKWPEWIETKAYKPPYQRSVKPVVTVINHATVLIQLDGLNILTDPQFSKRASPLSWLGPKRVLKPGILFEDLPPIDVVVISHNHYDHLDIPSLKMLQKKHRPLFLVGLGNQALFEDVTGAQVIAMDWWESRDFENLSISFVPCQHWSARGLFDKREMLWGGFYIKGASSSVYFAGDTGAGKFFNLIREKLGAPDISLLPIGAYEPRWFMKYAHMNPEEAVLAHKMLKTSTSIGIHFGTFQLTDESYQLPVIELKKAVKKHKLEKNSFLVPIFGKAIEAF